MSSRISPEQQSDNEQKVRFITRRELTSGEIATGETIMQELSKQGIAWKNLRCNTTGRWTPVKERGEIVRGYLEDYPTIEIRLWMKNENNHPVLNKINQTYVSRTKLSADDMKKWLK